MEMSGEFQIPARREAVWAALNDLEVLKASIPGCETLTRNADGTLAATITAAIGPVTATFVGVAAVSDLVAPESMTVTGEGDGGPAGTARGAADVRLVESGDGTLVSYAVKAQLGGQLAQLGSRLTDSKARSMAETFLAAIAARVGGEPTVAAPPLATPGPDEAAEEELVDRIEHRVEDEAFNVAEAVEEVEEELEVAAGRGVLGGPYVWGLLALLVVIVLLAIFR